jgi:hypothetical protein
LTASCRVVDPTSTDLMIESAHAADVVEGETAAPTEQVAEPPKPVEEESTFGAGVWD